MKKEDAIVKYNEYFDDVESKARAFDEIAEHFYFSNFGTMSKTDLETLMFSLYINRILDKHSADMQSYSDYNLSKILGVTQSKISSLKVRKELVYPYEDFNWKDAFEKISENAIYEDNKIRLLIPDKNVYLEVKNAIESTGGYVETQLSSNLLQLRVEFFLDLLIAISEEKDRDAIRRDLKNKIKEQNKDIEWIEGQSFGSVLKEEWPNIAIELFSSFVPVFSNQVQIIANNIYSAIKNSRKGK